MKLNKVDILSELRKIVQIKNTPKKLIRIIISNAGLQDIVEEIMIRKGIYMVFPFLY